MRLRAMLWCFLCFLGAACDDGEPAKVNVGEREGPCYPNNTCNGTLECVDGRCVEEQSCEPQCEGKCCGDDGCGGQCSDLCGSTGQSCNAQTCLCDGDCVPRACETIGMECGTHSDGCGGSVACGDCSGGLRCELGQCVSESCPGTLSECGTQCVDARTDPRHCGGCDNRCAAGNVCEQGGCVEAPNCQQTPCTGLTYCDLASSQCLPGCIDTKQCPNPNEICDLSSRECSCAPGWSGLGCTTPICTQACLHGSCVGPEQCECVAGWMGSTCESPVCTAACQNGGSCAEPNTCSCPSAWTGATCDLPVCMPACLNGGNCTSPNTCSCASGWTGSACETPVCTPVCQNGGSCTSPDTCSCASGWTGTRCETPICTASCQNGGTCVGPNTCSCVSGWSGASCSTPACTPACENGGVCSGPNTCTCPKLWIGPSCAMPDRIRIPSSGSSTSFTMGCPNEDGWCDFDTLVHDVTLSAYLIDRYPVTAASYKLCVDAGVCSAPMTDALSTYYSSSKREHPVNFVDWQQASTYCGWAGGRLPTEAEWERAAKGTTHRRFPWGDDCPTNWDFYCQGAAWTPSTARANVNTSAGDDGYDWEETSPVDAFSRGISPDGLWDMSGNVGEWVSDWYDNLYYFASPEVDPPGPMTGTSRVVRGGDFVTSVGWIRASARGFEYPSERGKQLGFRCAQSVP